MLATPGAHTACAYGINVATGSVNSMLGCRAVVVPDRPPIGSLDSVTGGTGTVAVTGWAIDPDTSSAIDVHVYVDGGAIAVRADQSRPDVGAAYPGAGPQHGFVGTIGAGPGRHVVCAYGIDVGGTSNTLLGCRSVSVS